MHREVQVPISPTELPVSENEVRYDINQTQYALICPSNGRIHAQGTLSTVAKVWDMERNLGDDLKLEVRELYLKEIRILTEDELNYEIKRRRTR